MDCALICKAIIVNDVVCKTRYDAFYLLSLPNDFVMPSVQIEVISGSDGMTHSGPDRLEQDLVRIHSRGSTDKQAHLLSKAIHDVLHGFVGVAAQRRVQMIQHRNRNTGYEEEAGIYRIIDDYRVYHSPAA